MDQKEKSRLAHLKCCAGINNPRCSRKNLRHITLAIIEQIQSLGYDHQLDETMRICESCRLVISDNRSIPAKKRRSGGDHVLDDPQPSTSGQAVNEILGKKFEYQLQKC